MLDPRTAPETPAARLLGVHILLDMWGVDASDLDDADTLAERLLQASADGGAHIVESSFHRFEPQGVSGVVILAESHVALHTWPEHGFAAVDIFTCGRAEVAEGICSALIAGLRPLRHEVRRLDRGRVEGAPSPPRATAAEAGRGAVEGG